MTRRRRHNPSVSDNEFWKTGYDNRLTYDLYYERIMDLAISRFEYKNLPETVDQRYMELALLGDGMAIYFRDDVIGDLCLRTMIDGRLGLYDIPFRRKAYANNGYNRNLTANNSVLIYNNYLRTPSLIQIAYYASSLSKLDVTRDININAQKTPILVTANERERLSMQNLYMKYDGNQPYIFGTKSFNPDSFKVFKTDAPFVADKLNILKSDIWNEMLSWLGISNISINKKERLITDEVQRSQGGTVASRLSPLEARRDGIEKVNKMFGTDIEVSFREDLDTTMPSEPYLSNDAGSEGGDSNE